MRYEYHTLFGHGVPIDALNAMSKDGWRAVGMTYDTTMLLFTVLIERPAQPSLPSFDQVLSQVSASAAVLSDLASTPIGASANSAPSR
jgi:hypothetical protein